MARRRQVSPAKPGPKLASQRGRATSRRLRTKRDRDSVVTRSRLIRDQCSRRASTSSTRNSAALSSTAGCRSPMAAPLLIIAGAGSGKTATLAHRVVHLIENGADPRRIMLLTFSRRAAAEMTRRVDRILADVTRGRSDRACPMRSPGPARFIRSARGYFANMPTTSGLRARSRFTIARIPPT